ncbi:YraN family protein [Facilibium subflavum]|uniref:YraN family protein n=1 Tax=Facilibium subflavum TaxID=2219058 RepID=UPI000E6496B8|nr:YraN family protein [Facilibium subflavum]
MSNKIGAQAEEKALQFLQTKGFCLIQRNFTTPLGEIDLIGRLENQLLFVEVKQRKNGQFGTALEMVTYQKQQKIRKASMIFLQKNVKYQCLPCRFDVISITADKLDWIQAAF